MLYHLEQEIREARRLVASLNPIRQNGRIIALSFKLRGIVGGGSRRKIMYNLIAMLDDWPSSLPRVFVVYPRDRYIRHINIYHPRSHPSLKMDLPEICWGDNEEEWERIPIRNRTISTFISFLNKVLNSENPSSPAR